MAGAVPQGPLEALVPVGFWRDPGDPTRPAELAHRDGESHLSRALAELAEAGFERAVLVTTNRHFHPRWLAATMRNLAAERGNTPLPDTEILVLADAVSFDSLILRGLTYFSTGLIGLICPLCSLPGSSAMTRVLTSACAAETPVIGLASVDWATALQLAVPRLHASELVGVALSRATDVPLMAFAGRAILPAPLSAAKSIKDDDTFFDNEKILSLLAEQFPETMAVTVAGPIQDARFGHPGRNQTDNRHPLILRDPVKLSPPASSRQKSGSENADPARENEAQTGPDGAA